MVLKIIRVLVLTFYYIYGFIAIPMMYARDLQIAQIGLLFFIISTILYFIFKNKFINYIKIFKK